MFSVVCTTLECLQNFYTERSRSTVLRSRILVFLFQPSAPSQFAAAPNFSPTAACAALRLCFEIENIAALVFSSKTLGLLNFANAMLNEVNLR